jgi:uncharacterized membrane protein
LPDDSAVALVKTNKKTRQEWEVGVSFKSYERYHDHPKHTGDQGEVMYSAEASVYISSNPQTTWDYVSNYQNFDAFMSNVKRVKSLDDKTSEWHLAGPLGIPVSWKAITTSFEPPRRLAWQSLEGSLETNGFISVTAEGSGSRVTVNVHYAPPGGAIGEAFAQLFKDPQKMLEHDLEKLAELIDDTPVEAVNEKRAGVRRH